MWWKLRRSEYEKKKGAANQQAFRKIVAQGRLRACWHTTAISLWDGARRAAQGVSRAGELARNEAGGRAGSVSVTCFYVPRARRRCGLTVPLLDAAVRFAGERGANIVEGYPVDPRSRTMADRSRGLDSSLPSAKPDLRKWPGARREAIMRRLT